MGVRLLVRTDLRNDKDKRSLRLSQEVNKNFEKKNFFLIYYYFYFREVQ